jgi:hypothetical protein
MIIKYIIQLFIINVIGRIVTVVVYPVSYIWRRMWRRMHRGNLFERIISFVPWVCLNDGQSNDVGYVWFWKSIGRYPNGEWWNDFVISYKWSAIRNIVWNIYLIPWFRFEGIKTDVNIKYSECWNEHLREFPCGDLDCRTIGYKYSDDGDAGAIGEYVDYNRSVLGMVYFTYKVNGKKAFRWGRAWVIEKKNCFISRDVEFGMTDVHVGIMNRTRRIVKDEKSIKEYREYIDGIRL